MAGSAGQRPIRVNWPKVAVSRRGPIGGLREVGLCPDPFHDSTREVLERFAELRSPRPEPGVARIATEPDPEAAAERRHVKSVRHRRAQSKDRR